MTTSSKKTLSILSWNVNGLRAIERKESFHTISDGIYDIVCLQETKISHPDQCSETIVHPDGYASYWHCSTEKKGYSGTVTYTKTAPKSVKTNFGDNALSWEGRVIETEFDEFVLLNIYFPNGGSGPVRLDYKLAFYNLFLDYIVDLKAAGKHVIFLGDVNTAHHEIDLARPAANINNSGFMPIERVWLDKFEAAGFVDTFRLLHPDAKDVYTWWDMKTGSRARNVGWRIDYIYVDESLKDRVKKAFVLPDITGSDHCPVGIELAMN